MAHILEVGGFVLVGRRVRLPADLPTPVLAVVAFRMWHQRLVDAWIAWAQRTHPGLPVVEIPVISRAYRWQRPLIDGGMIAGIRDREVLARTITVYTDTDAFASALGAPDTSTVVTVLTGSDGRVRASVRGPLDEHEAASAFAGPISSYLV